MYDVDVLLVLREYQDWRGRLAQAVQEVAQLVLLLDVLDLLDDVQVGRTWVWREGEAKARTEGEGVG